MATLHGVESVLVSSTERYAELGLQTPCRLGLLFWQGRPTTDETLPLQGEDGTRGESLLDGVGDLFADDNDDDNE
jgi:hypothetical protein